MLDRLRIKIFADGADLASMKALAANPRVKASPPTRRLMRKAGVTDYVAFAHEVLAAIPDRPVSFEVFADEFPEMEAQALEIASWGKNVYVKIPVTNTKRASAVPLVQRLSKQGVQLNVTAVFTLEQVEAVTERARCRHAGGHLGVRRPHRRHRRRSGAADGRGKANLPRQAEGRASVGEPARALNIFHADASAATSSP